MDQRFLTQGYLKDLKKAKIEIHARSAFLQGLLLMKPSDVPAYFSAIYPHLSQYHAYLANHELTPIAAALGFVMGIKEVDTVICGVNDHLQLQTLLISQKPLPCEIFNSFKLHDENYINPSKWKY